MKAATAAALAVHLARFGRFDKRLWSTGPSVVEDSAQQQHCPSNVESDDDDLEKRVNNRGFSLSFPANNKTDNLFVAFFNFRGQDHLVDQIQVCSKSKQFEIKRIRTKRNSEKG